MNLDKVKNCYEDALQKHGLDSKSVGWRDKETQHLRFKLLLSIIDNNNWGNGGINELGCGYGEMYCYLLQNNINFSHYFGYDISKQMLKAAENYLQGYNNITLQNSSKILKVADYSFTSGIFNTIFDKSLEDWEEYIKNTLENMYENSMYGFAFNMLTDMVDYKADGLYYANPTQWFEFCRKRFSRNVALFHNYGLWEWTIHVTKK